MVAMLSIGFDAWCEWTKWGDKIAVVGSWNEWDVHNPVQLYTDEYTFPMWSTKTKVQVDSGSVIEYKYVIMRGSGSIEWETLGGPNRTMVACENAGAEDTVGTVVEKVLAFPCNSGFHEKIRAMLAEKTLAKSKFKSSPFENDADAEIEKMTCSKDQSVETFEEEGLSQEKTYSETESITRTQQICKDTARRTFSRFEIGTRVKLVWLFADDKIGRQIHYEDRVF